MVNLDPVEKLDLLINEAWKLFQNQFMKGKFVVSTEAPFQHYLANVIKNLGDLYCFSRTELFVVDLETKEPDFNGKTKYIDITFSFYDNGKIMAKGAMELKFKKKNQGADDFARIDSYVDIQSLEHCLERGYNVGYFCMIADYDIYARESGPGTTGDIFSMRNNYIPPINVPIQNPNCKGRCDVIVIFKNKHMFKWKSIEDHIFLCLPVHNAFK
jgi:hypothetical protein